VPVPIDLLRTGKDPTHLQLVGYETPDLVKAPSFPRTQWPRDSDREWVTRVWNYFDHSPYWVDPHSGTTPKEAAHGFSTLRRPTLRARGLATGPGLRRGRVDAFVSAGGGGQALSVLVRRADPPKKAGAGPPAPAARVTPGTAPAAPEREIAVPWWALSKDTTLTGLVLDMDPAHFRKAPDFKADNWSSLDNGKWLTLNDDFFALPPVAIKTPPLSLKPQQPQY